MLDQLGLVLDYKGKLAYAVARNYRTISTSLTEYRKFSDELIEKYGEKIRDKQGCTRTVLPVSSPNFFKYVEEMAPYDVIEHEIEIMTVALEDTKDLLSAKEIIAIDWMLEDGKGVM